VTSWAAPSLRRAERWLEARRALVLGVILGLSALVRVVYFVQLSAGPYVLQHRWDQSDMSFFDEWGRRLAAGDWLGRSPLHPRHAWQLDLARKELATRPGLAAALGERPGASPDAAAAALVDRWYGGTTYHQEPLYAWLVGLTYAVLGPDVRHVFAWQLVVGVLANGLVYLVARRAFSDLVGAVAGVLALLCGTLVYYEMLLLRESLLVAASLLLVYWLLPAGRPRPPAFFLGLGAAGGLALLLKTSLALWLLPALAVRCLAGRRDAREAATRAAAVVLGAALVLLPVAARNVVVGAPPLALSGVGAMTFVNANAEDFPGDVGAFVSRHAGAILTDADGRLFPSALAALRTHPSVGSYARQLARKLGAVFHWYEIPNNANFYVYRAAAPVLGLPVTFLVVAPLALAGLVLGRRRAGAWPLHLMVTGNVATMLAFYPLSRFRAPLLAGLLPFAALALVRVVDFAAAGRRLRAALVVLAVAALGAWIGRPLPPGRSLVRAADCQVPLVFVYGPAYRDAAERGEWRSAAALALRAVENEPAAVRRLGPGKAATDDDRGCALALAELYSLAGDALDRDGEPRAAALARRRADELAAAAGAPAAR
jgi:4-amino-4-deoxy-L-arabinose transferase-like glycosyltransferase